MTENNFEKELTSILKGTDSLPFLFVGSGFSQRYLGLPNWINLLKKVSNLIDNNNLSFIRDKNEAAEHADPDTNYNDYMTYLCTLISKRLNNIWYTDTKFKNSREKYKELINNHNVPPIKLEISNIISDYKTTSIVPNMKTEFDLLKPISRKSIAGIITTNYDNLLESVFNFRTYSSQEELLLHNKYDLGEIYKIHGTVKCPESIMITESDYKLIEEKHKYISAKLLTIFVEHPIFFIGYSLNDEDIRNILHDILISLGRKSLNTITKRLFIVQWKADQEQPVLSTFTLSFNDGQTLTMKLITMSDFSDLYKIIAKNKTKYPVNLIRKAKDDIYNYVLTAKPSSKVVLSIPNKDLSQDNDPNVEFVYGFGILERARQGYSSVTTNEIFEDVVFDNKSFNDELLVEGSLPSALRASSGYLPIRKYVKNYDEKELPEIVKKNLSRFSNLNDFLSWTLKKEKRKGPSLTYDQAIKKSSVVKELALVDWNKNNIEQLGNYIRNTLSQKNFNTRTSDLRRLIRIYDFIKYK